MTPEQFVYWTAILMILNIPPHLITAHLFLRWRHYAIRPWVRNVFLAASIGGFLSVIIRITGILFDDDLNLRLLTAAIYVIGCYFLSLTFYMATSIASRRIDTPATKKVPPYCDGYETHDILAEVIKEVKQEVHKTQPLSKPTQNVSLRIH